MKKIFTACVAVVFLAGIAGYAQTTAPAQPTQKKIQTKIDQPKTAESKAPVKKVTAKKQKLAHVKPVEKKIETRAKPQEKK